MKSSSMSPSVKFLIRQWLASCLCSVLSLPLLSCVSVNFGPDSPARSSQFEFEPPLQSFRQIEELAADRAWQSEKTGNTIAFVSQCDSTKSPDLSEIQKASLSGINSLNVVSEEIVRYNERKARHVELTGQVDGVPIQMLARFFQKNGCTYTLTYMGTPSNFNRERDTFTTFLQNFEAK